MNDYSLSELPHQLSSARALRRRNEELTDIINKTQAIVKTHEQSEGFLDSDVKQTVARLKERQVKYLIYNLIHYNRLSIDMIFNKLT